MPSNASSQRRGSKGDEGLFARSVYRFRFDLSLITTVLSLCLPFVAALLFIDSIMRKRRTAVFALAPSGVRLLVAVPRIMTSHPNRSA